MTSIVSTIRKTRFLLIDDDPIYRSIISRAAAQVGMQVDTYESLSELGSVGMLGRYDAVIVDYDLENLTGVEIAEYVDALFGNIPLILVSEKERTPDTHGWPASIRKFVKKSDGYAKTLEEARRFVA